MPLKYDYLLGIWRDVVQMVFVQLQFVHVFEFEATLAARVAGGSVPIIDSFTFGF